MYSFFNSLETGFLDFWKYSMTKEKEECQLIELISFFRTPNMLCLFSYSTADFERFFLS